MEISTVFYQSILIIIMEISTVFYPSKYLTAQGVHKAVQNNDNILQCQAENIYKFLTENGLKGTECTRVSYSTSIGITPYPWVLCFLVAWWPRVLCFIVTSQDQQLQPVHHDPLSLAQGQDHVPLSCRKSSWKKQMILTPFHWFHCFCVSQP